MRRISSAALALLLLPALASGQEPVSSFEQLNTRLRAGDRVIVTDKQGREHEGKILELSPSSLTLSGAGTQAIPAGEVKLVQDRAHDSLKNGALIGLAAGAALGAGFSAALCESSNCEGPTGPLAVLLGAGMYGGIGAAIGTGIDAVIPGQKRVVYRALDGGRSARLALVPILGRHRKGLALSFSF